MMGGMTGGMEVSARSSPVCSLSRDSDRRLQHLSPGSQSMHSRPASRQAQRDWGASEHLAKRLHSQQFECLAVCPERRR